MVNFKKQSKILKIDYKIRLFNTFLFLVNFLLLFVMLPWFLIFYNNFTEKNEYQTKIQNLNLKKDNKKTSSKLQKFYKEIDGVIQNSYKFINKDIPFYFAAVLQTFVNYTDKLYITNISYFNKNGEDIIKISGVAKNRDALIALKDELKNKEFIKEVSLPIDNLLSKQDIKFSIDIIVKP